MDVQLTAGQTQMQGSVGEQQQHHQRKRTVLEAAHALTWGAAGVLQGRCIPGVPRPTAQL